MPERSFIYCPTCEHESRKVELTRGNPESHIFRCAFGHAFEYASLQTMKPNMMKIEFREKPADTDIKVEIWIDPGIWKRFVEKHGDRKNATIASVLALELDDDMLIISGNQARELAKMGIKTGEMMLVTAKQNLTLIDENERITGENNRFYAAIAEKMGS